MNALTAFAYMEPRRDAERTRHIKAALLYADEVIAQGLLNLGEDEPDLIQITEADRNELAAACQCNALRYHPSAPYMALSMTIGELL
jgi:hypothetical protein